MEPILNVENLQKYYGARGSVTRAIDDFSFRVNEGEFVGIMGASGSGRPRCSTASPPLTAQPPGTSGSRERM